MIERYTWRVYDQIRTHAMIISSRNIIDPKKRNSIVNKDKDGNDCEPYEDRNTFLDKLHITHPHFFEDALNMSYISSPHTSFSYDESAIQEAFKDIDIGIMSEFESASNNLPNKNINRRALADLRYALGPPQLLPLSGSGSREISFKRWYDRDTG